MDSEVGPRALKDSVDSCEASRPLQEGERGPQLKHIIVGSTSFILE